MAIPNYINPTPYPNAYSNGNMTQNGAYGVSNVGFQPNPYNYMQNPNYALGQPQMTAQQTQPQQQQQAQSSPFVMVSSREAVKDIFVAPGQTVWAMSQNTTEFYTKSADNMGLATTRYFKFAEFDPAIEAAQMQAQAQQKNMASVDFVPRSEFNQFVTNVSQEINSLRQSALNAPITGNEEQVPPAPTPTPAKTTTKKAKENSND